MPGSGELSALLLYCSCSHLPIFQMPAPGLFYYYPTAIPLNGYGGGVMAATPTPMVRYRTAGAYIPAAAAAPAPEMMDYTTLYNGVSANKHQARA